MSSVPVDGQKLPADVCVIELGGTVGRVLGHLWYITVVITLVEEKLISLLFQVILNQCHSLKLYASCHFLLVQLDFLVVILIFITIIVEKYVGFLGFCD